MEEDKELKIKKNNKGLIITIIILVIVIIGMGIYLIYEKTDIFSNNKENTKAKTETKIDKNKQEDVKEEVNNEEVKPLNLANCLNNNSYTYSNATDQEEDVGLSMVINPDMRTITLNIDWSKFGPLSTATSYSSSVESYQITGFTKNINSVFVGEVGQDSMGITLFYLMEDKTVEYTPIFINKTNNNNTYYEMNYTYEYSADNRITGQHFITKGTIPGVNDVIKLYTANNPGGITTIGAKADGSFYDLGFVIK